jgi:hypothetical protein
VFELKKPVDLLQGKARRLYIEIPNNRDKANIEYNKEHVVLPLDVVDCGWSNHNHKIDESLVECGNKRSTNVAHLLGVDFSRINVRDGEKRHAIEDVVSHNKYNGHDGHALVRSASFAAVVQSHCNESESDATHQCPPLH